MLLVPIAMRPFRDARRHHRILLPATLRVRHSNRMKAFPSNDGHQSETDGRRLRADSSRRRIVEAMMELVKEGDVSPSAEAVAAKAGVGRRTVFRLFSDMETVYGEIQHVMLGRIEPIFCAPLEGRTWRDRLDEMIERRALVFEEILPFKTAADARRHRSAFLQEDHAQLARMTRQTLAEVLPKRMAPGSRPFEALDAALGMEMWQRLRHDQGLKPKAALAVMKHMADALAPRR